MSAQLLRDAARRLRGGSALVLGDVIADRYQFGAPTRVSREAPVLILEHDEDVTIPGGAGNAACNVAALGGAVILVGVVGDDREGELLREQLLSRGVSPDRLVIEGGRHTTSKTRIFAGSRLRGQQVVRVDRATVSPITRDTARQVLQLALHALEDSTAVLVSDYGYGTLDATLVRRVVSAARKRDIPVIVDTQADLSRYRGATVLTPNLAELEGWAGQRLATVDAVGAAATRLLRRTAAGAVLCTRGAEGMSLVTARRAWHLPVARRSEVSDVAGAGDTVAATVALGIGAGVALQVAAALADCAASVVVRKLGAATCSPAELRGAIRGMDPALETLVGSR